MSPCAECSLGHLALGHNVPIVQTCAECPPTLVVLARPHEEVVENFSVEVSSINESTAWKTI